MKILKLSDLWQNFMKNDNIFDIICEEGSKNQIWWRGRIERFSDSAPGLFLTAISTIWPDFLTGQQAQSITSNIPASTAMLI